MAPRRRAAIGFKAHTGWAAAVVLAEGPDGVAVVAKRRVEMIDGFEAAAVYHKGRELSLGEARALIQSAEQQATRRARTEIASMVAELGTQGCKVVASAVVASASKPVPGLEVILRSHALVHAAEGELYRTALALASDACGFPAVRVSTKELAARAARAAGLSAQALPVRLAQLGRVSGRPWAQDQRESALAAWVALCSKR